MHAEYSKRREVEMNWRILIIKCTSIYLMQHLMCPHNVLLSSPLFYSSLLFYPFSSYCLPSFLFLSILPLPFPLHLFPHLIFHCTCNCYDITMIWYFFQLIWYLSLGPGPRWRHSIALAAPVRYLTHLLSSSIIYSNLQSTVLYLTQWHTRVGKFKYC